MIYDVIVVGSGPGGAIAAAELARRGHAVLMVDRSPFPRDKTCGDGMPANVMQHLVDLGIDLRATDFEHQQINSIYIQPYAGRSLVIPEQASSIYSMVAPRLHFDNLLHEHTLSCGVHFEVMQVTEPLMQDANGSSHKRVVGVVERRGKQRLEHEARIVIAADGASSAIARGLRGRVAAPEETAVAIRAYGKLRSSRTLDPAVRFYYLPHLAPGYAWIFPVSQSRVNIGVGLFDQAVYKDGQKDLRMLLAEFAEAMASEFPLDIEPETIKSWPIPVWIGPESRVMNGAYLIGDAGRFADALTGGGIFPALVTGHLAAIAADRCLRGASALEAAQFYDDAWRDGIGRSLKRQLMVRDVLLARPRLFNATVNIGVTFPFIKGLLLRNLAGQHA